MELVNSFSIDHVVSVGGQELLVDLISMFKEMSIKIDEAIAANQADDMDTVYKSVHALRSGASNLGLELILERTALIETKVKSDHTDGMTELLESLKADYLKSIIELDKILVK
jgi:HPt (histidine-containing phosphotransfer) domain-containing protein